jgi:hypothetical protein
MAKTVTVNIKDNKFPPLTIEEGTSVIWRNLDPYAHSAETLRNDPNYFSAGALLPGESSSPVLFARAGRYEYLCRYHMGMTGVVNVSARGEGGGPSDTGHTHDHAGHADHGGHSGGHIHLKHYHGFVTGGRSSQRLFMTHTPVLADERHHFQVILQASLPEKAHADAYDALRSSAYGDGKVQIFHEHLALPDIGSGQVTTLPQSSFEYYPNDPEGVLGGTGVPGLEENIPVRIDRVLHFHQFETEADYPEALTYLVYGDADDVFVDHFINRAPSFHSVAKLKTRPAFFDPGNEGTLPRVSIPQKRIRDVSPKVLRRVAFVDNSFHLFWLPPPGVYPLPADPLKPRRADSPPNYDVLLEDGRRGRIEIGRFLHFDVRLLNYGVLIVT